MAEATNTSTEAAVRGGLVRLMFGTMAAQVVGSATRFGLPDALGDGVRSAPDLAAENELSVQSMRRLLRALAALDILVEESPDHFRLAPAGALLRTDRPDSMHALVRVFTAPLMCRGWEHLDTSLRTGETSFDAVFGTDFFGYLKDKPELSALFNAAMSQGTQGLAAAVSQQFDFGSFTTVADIGGGDGTLVSAVLRAYPHLSGIVFDTVEGSAQAVGTLEKAGVADRCRVVTGDFFAAVPEGADLYLLKSILHDWDDDRAATILGHCRRVVPETGRLLIVEPVLPETVEPKQQPVSYLSDLNMLVNVGGLERTRSDFVRLCERAGFTLTAISQAGPGAGLCLIEAAPA
ncbi:methyltransferase [Nocardiopsis ansamitocini]|uniref:Methyltransferase n=1 Tax=Nocardiopsis ansamitocini TaxID=1670832 RepID=A0A9W6P373_9ACTN|nr:methyltransferase [Nocardiopsis ansamitocini]GLU46284.1 methyltransferase [Nocardiopsis ansamitocini]